MPSPTTNSETKELVVVTLGFVLGVVACFAYGAADLPILPKDNQHYFFMAERAAAGVPPHVSAFDPKNSLPSLLGGAAIRAGDVFGIPAAYAARALSIVGFGVFVAAVALFSYRESDSEWAAAFSGLAALGFSMAVHMAAVGSRPKIFVMTFVALALLSIQRRQAFRSALWSSLAMLCWQPAVLVLLALFLCEATCRRNWRWLVPFFSGAMLPVLLFLGYFWSRGALGPLWEQTVVFPREYLTHSWPGFWNGIQSIEGYWYRGFGPWNYLPWVALIALLSYLVRIVSRRAEAAKEWRRNPAWAALALMTIFVFSFSLLDHQGPVDLFALLPFVSILAASSLVWIAAKFDSRLGSRRVAHILVAALLGWVVVDGRALQQQAPFELKDQLALAVEVRQQIDAGERVYALNSAHLLGLARADNWLVYSSFFRNLDRYLVHRNSSRIFIPDRDGQLPTIILKGGKKKIPGWNRWLQAHYRPLNKPEFKAQNIGVWTLRSRFRHQ